MNLIRLPRKTTKLQVTASDVCVEALEVILGVADISADLGGSSKYSNVNFED